MHITPFFCRLVPAANCNVGDVRRNGESSKSKLVIIMWHVFSRFAVCFKKNDYNKTGTLNTETDQRCTDAHLLCHKKEIHYLRIGLLVFGMWRFVERTRTLNPGQRRWRSVLLWNMWNQSPHKEVWYLGRLKSFITTLWKPQKSKIQYLFIIHKMAIKKFTLYNILQYDRSDLPQ